MTWGGKDASPLLINGTVTRIGYYGDTLPKLVISLPKVTSDFSWLSQGVRYPIILRIFDKQYTAALRTTPKSAFVTISPDLIENSGRQVRLVDLLAPLGFFSKDKVPILVESDPIQSGLGLANISIAAVCLFSDER